MHWHIIATVGLLIIAAPRCHAAEFNPPDPTREAIETCMTKAIKIDKIGSERADIWMWLCMQQKYFFFCDWCFLGVKSQGYYTTRCKDDLTISLYRPECWLQWEKLELIGEATL